DAGFEVASVGRKQGIIAMPVEVVGQQLTQGGVVVDDQHFGVVFFHDAASVPTEQSTGKLPKSIEITAVSPPNFNSSIAPQHESSIRRFVEQPPEGLRLAVRSA